MHTLNTDEPTMALQSIAVGRHIRISQVYVQPRDARRLLWLGVFEGSHWCLVQRDGAGNVILEGGKGTVSLRAEWVHGMRVQYLSQAAPDPVSNHDGDFGKVLPPDWTAG